MTVKLCAFELDYVIWDGRLDARFGIGKSLVAEDNLRLKSGSNSVVENQSDPADYVALNPDIARLFNDLNKNNIQIAITSNNGNKKLCDRTLWLFRAPDKSATMVPLTKFITFDENSLETKVDLFRKLQEWTGLRYNEMVFFDLDCFGSKQVRELGVNVKVVDKRNGLRWKDYVETIQAAATISPLVQTQHGLITNPTQHILINEPGVHHPPDELAPYSDMPPLGKRLGSGKFADVYRSDRDPETVIKVLKNWKPGFQKRFVAVYKVIESGRRFEADPTRNAEDEQFLSMIAMEFRNLRAVGELKAPMDPERFCGWFSAKYTHGTPIWEHRTYRHHPFSPSYQLLVRRACHLAVDQIETVIKKSGIEHRDAHLANVKFMMEGDKLVSANLLDWGFAVRMKWDGRYYIRGNDVLVWNSGEPNEKYTPEELRRYWIEWMVKTEYEAKMRRQIISKEDGYAFLKDLKWWFERDSKPREGNRYDDKRHDDKRHDDKRHDDKRHDDKRHDDKKDDWSIGHILKPSSWR